jgi:hypothetical protein
MVDTDFCVAKRRSGKGKKMFSMLIKNPNSSIRLSPGFWRNIELGFAWKVKETIEIIWLPRGYGK